MRSAPDYSARCGAERVPSARRAKSCASTAERQVPRSWQRPAILHFSWSEQFLLPSQISECSDVRDVQGDSKLVFRADLSERKAPVFERKSAAGSVIAYVDELVLQ